MGPVVDIHAAPFGFDEAGFAELGEVVADGGFGQAQSSGEVAAVFLVSRGVEEKDEM